MFSLCILEKVRQQLGKAVGGRINSADDGPQWKLFLEDGIVEVTLIPWDFLYTLALDFHSWSKILRNWSV